MDGITLDQLRHALLNARKNSAEIARLCLASGQPERAASLILMGTRVDQVPGLLAPKAVATATDGESFNPSRIPSRFDRVAP